jgi:diguanylate cyclase (GGDEF)-like protein/PAS domain S-box-containing protein
MPDANTDAASATATVYPSTFETLEQFFEAVSGSVGAMIAFIDTGERIQYANHTYAAWFCKQPADVIGLTLTELYGADAYAAFSPKMRRAFAGEPIRYERELNKPDGGAAWISVYLRAHTDPAGKVLGVFACSLVVDEVKRTSDSLDAALRMQAIYMENSPLAVIEWNERLEVQRWSGRAEAIFGWKPVDAVGRSADDLNLLSADWRPTVETAALDLLKGRVQHNRLVVRNRTKRGRNIHCEWFSSVFMDANGRARGILSLAEDITLRVESEEQLRYAAVHDTLTGLQNRQSLISRLDHALVRAARSGAHLALLFIDLDKFKAVNDTHGHAAGDELLRQVATRLKENTSSADTVARIGGDEFVVLLESDLDKDTPELIAGRIISGFAKQFALGELEIATGASIGISRFPEDGADADQLMACADRAMYRAKHAR